MSGSNGFPTLDGSGGGGGGLDPRDAELFHAAQQWLTQHRGRLGANRYIELADPQATHMGLSCTVRGVVELTDEIRDMFKGFDRKSSTVATIQNDATGGHGFRVTLGGGGPRLGKASIGRFLDEPRLIISLILLVFISAAFTTPASRWSQLARSLVLVLRAFLGSPGPSPSSL